MTDYGFSDTVLRAIYRFFGDWEGFIKDLPAGADRQFHEQALRLAKGLVKAYRTWREDRRPAAGTAQSITPASNLERVKVPRS